MVFKIYTKMLSNFPKNQSFGEFFRAPDLNDPQTLRLDQTKSKCNINLQASDLIYSDTISLDQNECNTTSLNLSTSFPNDCLKFISDILLEENLEENLVYAHECKALQATEKSLYDALCESYSYSPSSDIFSLSPNQNPKTLDCTSSYKGFKSFESNLGLKQPKLVDSIGNVDDHVQSFFDLNLQYSSSSSKDVEDGLVNEAITSSPLLMTIPEKGEQPIGGLWKLKSHQRDGVAYEGWRSSKLQASSSEDYVEMEQYDDILLCRECNDDASTSSAEDTCGKLSKKRGHRIKRARVKKQNIKVEEVDLRTLLIQCAQAISNFDRRNANELLKQIRQHSSPYGDSTERLSHHVAYGLEMRLAGTASTISSNLCDMKISSSEFLKAYRLYVTAIPFKTMSYYVANNAILTLAEKATKIHIIDFGIFLGLQWPCFIQALSKRPNGPPQLCITGIDFPQQGFRPAERVSATGRRLSGYCERFGVPFQYQGIADKWENIKPKDLKIEGDELVIVNCMLRSGTLLDETVDANSPRDGFLKLVRNLNPHLFIHGIVNGTFTAPFFINRFKEALFHYSSWFEMFDATLPREAHERLLIENEIYGKEVTNVVACEGKERVQRPETYKHWQVRAERAGLRQAPLDNMFVSKAKAMVKASYHKDFLVDEDRLWMLQGWKGRTFCALSFWEPS